MICKLYVVIRSVFYRVNFRKDFKLAIQDYFNAFRNKQDTLRCWFTYLNPRVNIVTGVNKDKGFFSFEFENKKLQEALEFFMSQIQK